MEKEFIKSLNLAMFKYYETIFRLDVIIIGDKNKIYCTTKRTINKKDDETWTFLNQSDAEMKMREYVSKHY